MKNFLQRNEGLAMFIAITSGTVATVGTTYLVSLTTANLGMLILVSLLALGGFIGAACAFLDSL